MPNEVDELRKQLKGINLKRVPKANRKKFRLIELEGTATKMDVPDMDPIEVTDYDGVLVASVDAEMYMSMQPGELERLSETVNLAAERLGKELVLILPGFVKLMTLEQIETPPVAEVKK